MNITLGPIGPLDQYMDYYSPSRDACEIDTSEDLIALEEALLAVENERDEALTSLRWALHQIANLLPAARNIRVSDWQCPDWEVACARAGISER